MSGQLEFHGFIDRWDNIKTFLFPRGFDTSTKSKEDDQWGNWEWEEDDSKKSQKQDETVSDNSVTQDESWLQECVIANSPMGDVFVVARKNKAVFLTSEWDAKNGRLKYSKSFEGVVSQEDGEEINCSVCIPLISKKKSSPGAPDWTCVVLGFNSGYVKIYTDTGCLLISQLFHNEEVKSIKCRSYQPAKTSFEHDQLEEIIILYKTVVVTMDGFGLFQTLRACRNHLARLQANAAESIVDPPPLSFKKWAFEHANSSDCEGIGLYTACTFDNLVTGSIQGGFNARCSAVPQTYSSFVITGEMPFLSFELAQEDQANPLLTEIAYAVASKLKSSLLSAATGFLGFGGGSKTTSSVQKEKPKIEAATKMGTRCGLQDSRRIGKSIAISPCRKLSAVTDKLGRVTLIDNERQISVRIWKGYRDAQCAWLQVDEELSSRSRNSPRKALFLVIYAPRRGNLEVFAMQQGPKVATFPVNKSGRLLSTSYGMMGLNNIPIKGGNKPVVQCAFFDNNGQIQTLNIPFHLALCDKTSSKIKDMHLLKSLQRLLKDDKYGHTEVMELLMDIKTQSMINQSFRLLCQKCKKLEVISTVVQSYLQDFCDEEGRDLTVVFSIQSLIDLYTSLTSSAEIPPSYSTATEASGSSHDKTILCCLHATGKEITMLQSMSEKDCVNKKLSKSVKFEQDERLMTLNEFLLSFSIEFDPAKIKMSDEGRVHLNHKSENLSKLGSLLLCGCLNNCVDLNEWKAKIKTVGLIPKELMELTLKFWCENALVSSSYVGVMERLYQVIKVLCELEGRKSVTNEFSQVSKWWEDTRKEIAKSSQLFHVYSFSIVCRGAAIDLQQEAENEKREKGKEKSEENVVNSSEDETDWENISLDLLKWNFILKQIEDLSLLSIVLIQRPKLDAPCLPILAAEIDDLSVLNLLDKGKGCIAELVGKWLTSIGIDPELITNDDVHNTESSKTESLDNLQSKEATESKNDSQSEIECAIEALEADKRVNYVLELIKCLKENFSVSLSASIILANYCWEYCLEWNKESDSIEYFQAAVKCVNAIASPNIRQGMMSMMWSTFISKKLAAIVSKSKASREKLIDKVSGFSTNERRETFLKVCVNFLDLFMETNVRCESVNPPKDMVTKKNHWSNDASSASLTDLALIQPHSNYEMILLHYQLAVSAYAHLSFRMKKASLKPFNLFDTKARMMFFTAMSSQAPYSNVEVDLALKMLREEFLCLVISNAIHHIPEELDANDDSSDVTDNGFKNVVPSMAGVSDCEKWIQKSFELGRIWGLDLDGLRINQVCELYSSGLDLIGLETIGSVSARDVLGSKLLVIAGMRINYTVTKTPANVTEILASQSTNLSNWLDSLNYSKLRCLRFSTKSIAELAKQITQLIPESSYDFKLAEEVLLSSNYL